MTTRIRRLDHAIPNAGGLPTLRDPSEHSRKVVSMLAGRLDRWLWAGGEQLSSSPLTMRDAGRGDALKTLGLGTLSGGANDTFSNHNFFNLPGGDLQSQFRLEGDPWPDQGYSLLISLMAPADTGLFVIGGRSGTNPYLRIDTDVGRLIWQQGAPGANQNWIVLNETVVPNAKMLLLYSYDVVSQTRRIYLNSATHLAEQTSSPNVDPSGYFTYVGGNNSMAFDAQPAHMRFGDWLRIKGAMHGSLTLDRMREDLMKQFASYYGWTLTA